MDGDRRADTARYCAHGDVAAQRQGAGGGGLGYHLPGQCRTVRRGRFTRVAPVLGAEPAVTPGTANTIQWSGVSWSLLNETFEGYWPGTGWSVSGAPTWDDTSYDHHGGSWSGWCAGSSLDPANGYANNMWAWMVYGPFSLYDAANAQVTFWYKNYSEAGWDYFRWLYSTGDGFHEAGSVSGDQNTWREQTWDLSVVAGEPVVWLAFRFDSDGSVCGDSGYTGAYVDDIVVTKQFAQVEYYAERANNSSFTSPVNSGWIQQLQCTFSGLTPGQTYWYRVRARWGGEQSGWSNVEYSQQASLPEVEVRGNNVIIVDGDTTPSTTDHTDFGSTCAGTPVSRLYTVRNLGATALTTSGLTVPSGFTVTEGLDGSIPGAARTPSRCD